MAVTVRPINLPAPVPLRIVRLTGRPSTMGRMWPDPPNASRPPRTPTRPDRLRSLAIETSGRIGSVALGRGPEVLEAEAFSTTHRHAVELLPTVVRICAAREVAPDAIDEVYVSGGPGSFTGLRVGVTFARALAFACGVKIVRVPTLDVIAQNALDVTDPPEALAVILDAKRKRIFAAAFALTDDGYARAQEPAELDPDGFFAALPAGCRAIGEGILHHQEAVARARLGVLPESLNRARAEVVHRLGYRLARQGRFDDPACLVPIYVRRPQAEEVWEARHGRSDADR
ncbi:MAG: tRNA (adenosine(37)-N6)-threonylcarbamoyltransferase complex dimerization subunit type 1 TsaB [Phycisphaerales bacterium]|nr:MAG: tRNA (adenosine(37)-N6)-threonylcarbamoyltransferase complex dimerization subunit type 1 TsaB [Phycisphaerales bacterium]